MPRALLAAALLTFPALAPAAAQFRAPRSGDYLFAASVQDARALWVNPAGLAVIFEASIMGEVLVVRNGNDDLSLAQITAGFNSRGFAFAFRRDRFDDSTAGNTWRFGGSRAFRKVTVGVSFTIYSADINQREVDLGIRLLLAPTLQVGAVLRHIGEPVVRGVRLRPTGVFGLSWSAGGVIQLNGETTLVDPRGPDGLDVSYRAGVMLSLARVMRLPLGILSALDLRDDLGVDRLLFGLVLGGADRFALVGGGARREDTTFIDGISLTALSTRPLGKPSGLR